MPEVLAVPGVERHQVSVVISHKQHAASGGHGPGPDADRRAHHPVHAKLVKSGHSPDNVDNGVDCPNLVEMNPIDRGSVGLGLGGRKPLEGFLGPVVDVDLAYPPLIPSADSSDGCLIS